MALLSLLNLFTENLFTGWLNRRRFLGSQKCFSFILFPYMVLTEVNKEIPFQMIVILFFDTRSKLNKR